MTPEQIEGSKSIVIFMNGEIDMGHTCVIDSYNDEGGNHVFNHIEGKAYLNFVGDEATGNYEKTCMVANLQYHKLWDWLMPVCKNIHALVNDGHKVSDKEAFLWCAIMDALVAVNIDLTFQSVCNYLKFHNNERCI